MQRKLASKKPNFVAIKGKKTRESSEVKTSERGFLLRLKISKYKNHTTYTLTVKKPSFSFGQLFNKFSDKKISSSKKQNINVARLPSSSFSEIISAGLVLGGATGVLSILIPLSPVQFKLSQPANATIVLSQQVLVDQTKSKLIYSLPRSIPTRMNIESIGLSTSLISTTVGDLGELLVPSRYDVAAWYDKSPTPGEIGPSVIVGHLNSFEGDAVFAKLSKLTPGSMITVTRADGTQANFKAEVIKEIPQDGFETDEVYGNINYAGLRLITCGGSYNFITGRYTNNTVVFASLSKE